LSSAWMALAGWKSLRASSRPHKQQVSRAVHLTALPAPHITTAQQGDHVLGLLLASPKKKMLSMSQRRVRNEKMTKKKKNNH